MCSIWNAGSRLDPHVHASFPLSVAAEANGGTKKTSSVEETGSPHPTAGELCVNCLSLWKFCLRERASGREVRYMSIARAVLHIHV